jgi:hypothetical protein
LRAALLGAPALVSVLAPSERQPSELVRRAKELHEAPRPPVNVAGRVPSCYEKQAAEADKDEPYFRLPRKRRETSPQLHPENGGRVIGLPASGGKVRVYSSVAPPVADGAGRVGDALYGAMRPAPAVSRGRAPSTPFGKRGWSHEPRRGACGRGRVRVTAEQCPRTRAGWRTSLTTPRPTDCECPNGE